MQHVARATLFELPRQVLDCARQLGWRPQPPPRVASLDDVTAATNAAQGSAAPALATPATTTTTTTTANLSHRRYSAAVGGVQLQLSTMTTTTPSTNTAIASAIAMSIGAPSTASPPLLADNIRMTVNNASLSTATHAAVDEFDEHGGATLLLASFPKPRSSMPSVVMPTAQRADNNDDDFDIPEPPADLSD